MSEVKRYHVTDAGLVEGQALGRINVVLGADHDRVTADADRLRAELECSRGDFVQLERISDALQQRLTAADERADVLEGLLREVLIELPFYRYRFRIQAVLEPLEASLEGPHLILDMCGIPIPASDFMKALGITYQLAVPQSMTDTWWFFNCDNMSDATPSRLRVLDRTAQQCVGWGLSQQMADEIKAWRKLPLKPVNLSVSIKPAEGGGDELV